MACRKIDFGGGNFAIVCGRGSRPKACAQCGRPSSKLCDYQLKGNLGGKTCDRALCVNCAVHVDPDLDYCRAHAELIEKEGRPPADKQVSAAKPVFGDPDWIKAKK